MAISRNNIYDENTSPAPSGEDFLTQYGDFMDALLDHATFRLINVSGTDTITADAEPVSLPTGGLVTGMKFTFVPAATNTGAATINIDSAGAQSIVNGDGTALTAGKLDSATRYLIEWDGTNFRILGSAGEASGADTFSVTTYDSSDTWVNDVDPSALVLIELWGAGGGGSSAGGGGGGGGAYARKILRGSELGSTETITVPSGGAAQTAGGAASFGSHLTAYGGAGASAGGDGGGGGGEVAAGASTTGGKTGGGAGGAGANGEDAKTIYAGGGGAGASGAYDGGYAVYGGGGGGGSTGGTGGSSAYGGDGGDYTNNGTRPGGGGGGGGGTGGGGRCRVTVFGG